MPRILYLCNCSSRKLLSFINIIQILIFVDIYILFLKTLLKRVIYCSQGVGRVNSILITILHFRPSSWRDRIVSAYQIWQICQILTYLKRYKNCSSWRAEKYAVMYLNSTIDCFRTVGISRFQFQLILQIRKNEIDLTSRQALFSKWSKISAV